jgi:multidrug efflux pump subunit AcrB
MSNAFFRNPRLVILTLLLIVVSGLSALELLPRREDPKLTERFASITTRFPGATAERVEALVTEKIEEELEQLDEIKEIQSNSRSGFSAVQVELRDDIQQVDEVWSKVRDRVADASLLFPSGAEAAELDSDQIDGSSMIVGFRWNSSEPISRGILRRMAEELSDELRRISGTKRTELYGAADEELLVLVDELEARRLGLSAAAISRAVQSSDAKVAAGRMRGPQNEFLIEVEGELTSLEAVRDIPLRSREGRIVRLGEIARVERSVVTPMRERMLIDGHEGVALSVVMMDGTRIDKWAADVRAGVANFAQRLPSAIDIELLFDQSRYVESRLSGLIQNFLLGVLLVIVVIWLIMGWRSALLVGSALPLSSLMVLGAMRLMEIPLHQMSVTGLIIALGLLIDNAIVIVDEVKDRLRSGIETGEAIARSVKHLFVPLLGSTLTTVFSFMPIVLMPGAAGEFVGSIGLSVILALLSSFFLAMTIVPALAGYVLGRRRNVGHETWWSSGIQSKSLARAYRASLGFFFARPVLGMLLALILPISGFVVAGQLEEQFFPPADRDQFEVQIQLPSQASIDETTERAREVRERILQNDAVARVHWFVGRGSPKFYYNLLGGREDTPSFAQALVQLKSKEAALQVINELQRDLDASFPDTQVLCKQLEQGPPVDAPLEIRIFGPDLEQLRLYGDQVRGVLASIPGVTHTRANLADAQPKLEVDLLPDEAAIAGLDKVEIAEQLQLGLEGRVGGSVLEATEELPVRVRLQDANRVDAAGIASFELIRESTDGSSHTDATVRARRTHPAAGDRLGAALPDPALQYGAGLSARRQPAERLPRGVSRALGRQRQRTATGLPAGHRRRGRWPRRSRRQPHGLGRTAHDADRGDARAVVPVVPPGRRDRAGRRVRRRPVHACALALWLPLWLHGHRGDDGPHRRRDQRLDCGAGGAAREPRGAFGRSQRRGADRVGLHATRGVDDADDDGGLLAADPEWRGFLAAGGDLDRGRCAGRDSARALLRALGLLAGRRPARSRAGGGSSATTGACLSWPWAAGPAAGRMGPAGSSKPCYVKL